jgi:hypothetical protein
MYDKCTQLVVLQLIFYRSGAAAKTANVGM